MRILALVCLVTSATLASTSSEPADPHHWLEEVFGDTALDWVRAENERTEGELTQRPGFEPLRQQLLAIYNSRERIPYVVQIGSHYYNFWRDAQHVRGIWRRTSPEQYRLPEPEWETVLDLDALGAAEDESWVWKGATVLRPDEDRVLVQLSRGGGDAIVVREFDLGQKEWVTDGFNLPEAKSQVAWIDRHQVFVGTDFGPDSLTTSGYPRLVKLWRRGTPLADAPLVFEAHVDDLAAAGTRSLQPDGREYQLIIRSITFYTSETFHRDAGGQLRKLDLPLDVQVDVFRQHLLVTLRSEWTVDSRTYPAGALLALPFDQFVSGARDFAVLFTPGPRRALEGFSSTRDHLILNELENVRHQLYVLTPTAKGWQRRPLPAPEFGSVSAQGVAPLRSNEYFLTTSDFLTPASLFHGDLSRDSRVLLKQLPEFFSADGLEITQHEAVSADGTRIPYFLVARKDLRLDGSTPTLLYGYGGFEVSMTPGYSGGLGVGWLRPGGAYVLANIRGGGEFGPSWHQAALKENRQRAYDDFIAVAEDLIRRRITSPAHLGIMGGSNGGLLVGVMLTQRPDLFGAVVCQVPLLDMRRYHRLLAGASWMGEYGNPDVPEEWEFIRRYSPYHNVRPEAAYPRTLLTTSTRDDRVHPGHARKMAARLKELGHDHLYFENTEGGHAGAADNRQQAFMNALAFEFLRQELTRDAPDQR
jgi:prolyl oligopeptidase